MRVKQLCVWGEGPALVEAATKEWSSVHISGDSRIAGAILDFVRMEKGDFRLTSKLMEVQAALEAHIAPNDPEGAEWAGQYQVGLWNGVPFVRIFPNVGTHREIEFWFSHGMPRAEVKFHGRGSRIQAERVIGAFVAAGFGATSLHAIEKVGSRDSVHFSSLSGALEALQSSPADYARESAIGNVDFR